MRSYRELVKIDDYYERIRYLMLHQFPSDETFGSHRWLNQRLYNSKEWRDLRRDVIIRDNGCDLGCGDHLLDKFIIIHHIEPITIDDIEQNNPKVFDIDNLISTCRTTHNMIHYGSNEELNFLKSFSVERRPGDTKLW